MANILVTGPDLAPEARDLLKMHNLIFTGNSPTENEIIELCQKHNPSGIILRYSKIGRPAMEVAPALKVISRHGAGVDVVDLEAAHSMGIEVRAAIGVNAAAVAEHTAALMLACAKSIVLLDKRMREGFWDKPTHKSIELSGRTVGLIGLGAIGLKFARIADAMDMKVIGYSRTKKDLPSYIENVNLDQIWKRSDVISLHCPLTPETFKMINAQTIKRCKKGVIFINTARGDLVDEQDLLEAIKSGFVSSAGLDTFSNEPVTSENIFKHENNTTMSPHVGGVSTDTYIKVGITAARNLLKVIESN